MPARLRIVTAEAPAGEAGSRPLVLLAEPDRLRAALIAASLDDRAVDVAWAPHGDVALASAEELSFDVHVVDPSMQTAGGECVAAALVTEHPGVPLVVTGRSTERIHDASARIPPAELVELVHAALAQPGGSRRRGQG